MSSGWKIVLAAALLALAAFLWGGRYTVTQQGVVALWIASRGRFVFAGRRNATPSRINHQLPTTKCKASHRSRLNQRLPETHLNQNSDIRQAQATSAAPASVDFTYVALSWRHS
jgi:hypothetical protein